jgi:hypothetical protein
MFEEMVKQLFANDPHVKFRHVTDWQCETGLPDEDVGVWLLVEEQNICSEQSIRFLLNQHPQAKAICISQDGKHAKVMTLKLDVDEVEQLDTHVLAELIKQKGHCESGYQQ